MTSAELVFVNGYAPNLTTAELTALLAALDRDDPRLCQGHTTTPPPLMSVAQWPVESADAIGYCGLYSDREGIAGEAGSRTVGTVEEFFAARCFDADNTLGEPAGCRWFLNYWDDSPRAEVIRDVSAWVRRVLAERASGAIPPGPGEFPDRPEESYFRVDR